MPADGRRPVPAEPVILSDKQSFTEAEGMDDGFGRILDQDTDNLFPVSYTHLTLPTILLV